MVKEAPNNAPMNMLGLAQTSRKILEDGDVPIFLVVLITPDSLQLTVILLVSHYPHSARRLLESGYVTDAQCPRETHLISHSYKFSHSLCLNSLLHVWLRGNKRYQVTLFRYINQAD